MNCLVCKIEFEGRADAKYCSPKCRKEASRLSSVTDNVTLSVPIVTDNLIFKFTVKYKPLHDVQDDVAKERATIREAKYWYDVPLGAIPIIQKDWPEMPEFMNGRQYFLWWKNEFKTMTFDGRGELPEILNPFPSYTNTRFEQAGEGSRRWGA
jgi:hypothetical protein